MTDFDWKRFWCPRDKGFDLSDRGFLADPDGPWGKYQNVDLVAFERLAELPCAVMLGEPGIGKSWTLKRESALVERSLGRGAKSVSFDLRSINTDSRLMAKLFDSEVCESWRKGDWLLHVFLDSLDECMLRIENVASILADELPKLPVDRLRLRIACRTATWPPVLEEALKELFGDCNAHELVPLRRIDVQRAVEQSGIPDTNAFLSRVDELEISSLAIKPVTLKFLISTYLQDGDLPRDHLELYEKGCRILVEEGNVSRRSAGQMGRLNPDERLAVASRIAAVTQLCSRFAVYTGREAEGVPPEDVRLDDLSGGTERAVDEVNVTREALWEVLDTGLFSSRGADRFGWAHQTYAEFLTARYCKRLQMPVEQIRPLLFHPSEQGRRLIPQLHEVAAWMSAMDSEILKAVAGSDPEALLGAAAASLTDEDRRLIVASLLQQATGGRTLHLQWGLVRLYRKLRHAQLPDQLRPLLREATLSPGVRHVAINIARACTVQEVGSELADVALDLSADRGLRYSAAAAAAEVGSKEVRARLRPLAFGESGDDPNDELKGSGLRAIWPESISASELFTLLTPPLQGFGGTYSRFLYENVIQNAEPGDLPVALAWFAQQRGRQHLIGAIDNLMDLIVQFAWDNLGEPGVASGLATAVLSRLSVYDAIVSRDEGREFATKVQEDPERRRTLLRALLPQVTLNGVTELILRAPIFAVSDVDWLIDRALSGEANESAFVEAKLIRLAVIWRDGWKNRELAEKLWYACKINSILDEECRPIFEVDLSSPEVDAFREQERQKKERKSPKLLVPTPSDRIETGLQKIERGDVAHWIQLTLDLTLEPTSSHYGDDSGPNLTGMPGWKAADDGTRKRILDAAVRYLNESDPKNHEWFQTPNTPYSAIGGFRALALLALTEDKRLDSLPARVWANRVPILLKSFGATDELKLRARLLRRAHESIPDETRKWILSLVDGENERDGHLFITNEVEICWDERLGGALLGKSKSSTLKPQILASILEWMFLRGFPGARESAESCIEAGLSGTELARSQAAVAANVMLRVAPDAGWATIWPIIKGNNALGRAIVESVTYGDSSGTKFTTKLSDAELGELYLWMVENYPPGDRSAGFRVLGPSDTAEMFGAGLLESLKNRGTFAACDALRRVMEKLPGYGWMRFYLEQAEDLARTKSWNPVSISEFLALATDRDKRFVESGIQLIEAITESLDRLQKKLQGELPAVRDLWNTRKGEFSPKDEHEVADYIARHFREDFRGRGIIVNREVQVQLGIGARTGQRTDIYVDAVAPGAGHDTSDHLCAIVEVKGNWHRELSEAMETQLRDRYLKEYRCRNGLYLAAWFTCAKWDDADSRNKHLSPMSLSDARQFFSRQAMVVSTPTISIRSYVLDASLS
jgi:hypothetical protein